MAQPVDRPVFLPIADPQYRMPEDARERLRHALNTDALEALLARTRPELRAGMLGSLVELASRGKIAFGPMLSDVVDDPEILRLLVNVTSRSGLE